MLMSEGEGVIDSDFTILSRGKCSVSSYRNDGRCEDSSVNAKLEAVVLAESGCSSLVCSCELVCLFALISCVLTGDFLLVTDLHLL